MDSIFVVLYKKWTHDNLYIPHTWECRDKALPRPCESKKLVVLIKKSKNGFMGFFLRINSVFLIVLFCYSGRVMPQSHLRQNSVSPSGIIQQMLAAIRNTNTMTFRLNILERINGRVVPSACFAKVRVNPPSYYLNISEGFRKGVEMLWVEGENDGDALIYPGTFPYINLDINPKGSLARQNQHHTIFDTGFDYFGKIVSSSMDKLGEKYFDCLKITGDTIFDYRPCFILNFDYPGFGYKPYVVQNGETLENIAAKFHVNDYMIYEKNPGIEAFDAIEQGTTIMVPELYGKAVQFFVDKINFLPVVQIIYDDMGLYEKYEFYDLKVNIKFKPDEFTEDFEEYGF